MASTYTSNLVLRKPENRDPETFDTWDQSVNGNMDLIDAAFGARSYTVQNVIQNSDTHSQSLDKLDQAVGAVPFPVGPSGDLQSRSPTVDQKAALIGPVSHLPSVTNPYATVNWVALGAPIARKIILSPEYPGGVLWADGAVITAGSLTSDFEFYPLPPPGAGFGYNFYKWVSTAVFQETYYVVIRWRVPESFTGFRTTANKALIVDIATEDTGTNAQIDAAIFKDTGGVPIFSNLSLISSTVAGVWYSERVGNEKVFYDATDPVLASIGAGDVLVMQIAMNSQNNKWAKIGDITIQYNG